MAQPEVIGRSIEARETKGTDSGNKDNEKLNLVDIFTDPVKRDIDSTLRKAWHASESKSKPELDQESKALTEKTGKSLKDSLANHVGHDYADRLLRMMDDKGKVEIPETNRMDANKLIKKGSTIEPGKLNEMKLGDRTYDVYVPKTVHAYKEDGQLSVPAIIAIHGVENDTTKNAPESRHMADASGLNLVADRLGMAVIYPHAKPRMFDGTKDPETGISSLGKVGEYINKKFNTKPLLAWNTHDHDLLPSDKSYNDLNVVDNIKKDVESHINISNQVGVLGHSDGGRMSQMYTVNHPEDVAALATFTSTWMNGAERPQVGKPMWAILGDEDRTLNIDGNQSMKSRIYDFILPTNSEPDKHNPRAQGEVWASAATCTDSTVTDSEKVNIQKYSGGKDCDVRVDIVKGNGHAIPTYQNLQKDGQWAFGNFTYIKHDNDYSYEVAKWMKGHILAKK
ncbi:MAG: hypothetical protein K2X77_09350 [Candidatus Obscuribacterales bacterium]|nr:hypothetical protein [Candidatus Obscuribacterales bacterium]